MQDDTLSAAFEATYLAEFRWIKAALDTPYTERSGGGSGTPNRLPISPARRATVYHRDGGRCYLCTLPVDANQHDGPWGCTIDHVRPLSHHGSRKALSNLALAHHQCNQMKGSSPHPRTVYETDRWHCRRCQEPVSGPQQHDWQWNRPIVERLVPLTSPDIWWYSRSWTCHLRCHAYHRPVPPWVPDGSSTLAVPTCSEAEPLDVAFVAETWLSWPPHEQPG